VDQNVLYLRRKVDRPFDVEQFETVRGSGYPPADRAGRGQLGMMASGA